jgi:hypothetical protein
MTESVRGCDGNGCFRGLFGIKLELDFHCRGQLDRKRDDNLGIKKSSIDGKRIPRLFMGALEAPGLHDSGFGGFMSSFHDGLVVAGIWGSSGQSPGSPRLVSHKIQR